MEISKCLVTKCLIFCQGKADEGNNTAEMLNKGLQGIFIQLLNYGGTDMFCTRCGKEVNADWKICPNCGNPLNNMNTNNHTGHSRNQSGHSHNNTGYPGSQPRYSNNNPGYPVSQSGARVYGTGNRNKSYKPSPAVILWGAIAGIGTLCAIIFGGVMLSSGKENKVDTIGDYYVTGCKDVVKVRANPDEESNVLTKLSNGEKISLIEKENDEYWKIYIEAENVIGYIPNYYLTHEKDAVTDPVTKYVNIKNGATMTIRGLPKEDASAVGILKRGQEVTLMADMSGDFDYIYAVKSKTYGYVKSSKLSNKKVNTANSSDQATATPQAATPTQAQPQPQAQDNRIFGRAAAPNSHLGQYYVSVQKGYLALRNAKAFDSSNEIGQMNNGDYVWAIETGGTYWYVYSPSLGMYGYTNSGYLTTSPTTPSQTQSQSSYLGVYYANVASGYLALRNAAAYDSANEIGKIANGEEVDVMDMSASPYWYVYVPSLNQYGYVNSQYLR